MKQYFFTYVSTAVLIISKLKVGIRVSRNSSKVTYKSLK